MTHLNGVGGAGSVPQNSQANASPPPYEPPKAMTLSPQERSELGFLSDRAATGDVAAAGKLERLETLYHAREMAALAGDVYHHDAKAAKAAGEDVTVPTVPEGWSRASETMSPTELRERYGLSAADLSGGSESGFRAELYIPDPAVHGPNAEPVLAFKGTKASSAEDWTNNFGQGLGQQTDYYDRAMRTANKLDRKIDGGFEITGHSLGGGMASAAAAVTGEDATTFNAAGLHDATAARFLEGRGRQPAAAGDTTTAYVVDGEILDSVQNGLRALKPQSAEAVVATIQGGVRSAEGLSQRVDGASDSWLGRRVLSDDTRARIDDAVDTLSQVRTVTGRATGADLLAMPTAAGKVVPLRALDADGSARAVPVPDVSAPGGFVQQAERAVEQAAAIRAETVEEFKTWDRRMGPVDELLYGGEGLEDYGPAAGNADAALHILEEVGGFSGAETGMGVAGEMTARHGMPIVENGLEDAIRDARASW